MVMLEDLFGDIIAKARTGLGISRIEMAAMTGIDQGRLERLEECEVAPTIVECQALAKDCHLAPEALWQISCGNYCPTPPPGLDDNMLILPASPTRANTYIVPIGNSDQALVVDPGGDAEQILALAASSGLHICGILITHGHHDHVGAVTALFSELRAPLLVHPKEFKHAQTIALSGDGIYSVGGTSVQALACPGHTANSYAFLVGKTLFTGDCLFAGSMGRAAHPNAYNDALTSARRLLALPPDTTVYPGHGPVTYVWLEQQHNPFSVQAGAPQSKR